MGPQGQVFVAKKKLSKKMLEANMTSFFLYIPRQVQKILGHLVLPKEEEKFENVHLGAEHRLNRKHIKNREKERIL